MEASNTEEEEGCDVCGGQHITEQCPVLGFQGDAEQQTQLSKARLTLPTGLQVFESEDNIGVVASETIKKQTKYGPLEARKSTQDIQSDDHFLLKMIPKDSSVTVTFDTSDENECNWLCLVQPAKTEEEQNIIAYQLGLNVFFNTTKDIVTGEELKVWYAPQYARKMGKSPTPDGRALTLLGRQDIFSSSVTGDFSDLVKNLSFLTPKMEPGTTLQVTMQDGEIIDAEPVNMTQDGSSQHSYVMYEDREDDAMEEPRIIDSSDLYKCKRCDAAFEMETDLAKHIREHIFPWRNEADATPQRGRRRKSRQDDDCYCEQCDLNFVSYTTYMRHLKNTKKHRLKCLYCDFVTHEKRDLVNHLDNRHKDRTEARVDVVITPSARKSTAKGDDEEERYRKTLKKVKKDKEERHLRKEIKTEDDEEIIDSESSEEDEEEEKKESYNTSSDPATPSRVLPKRSLRGIRTTGVLAEDKASITKVKGRKSILEESVQEGDGDDDENWFRVKGKRKMNIELSPVKKKRVIAQKPSSSPVKEANVRKIIQISSKTLAVARKSLVEKIETDEKKDQEEKKSEDDENKTEEVDEQSIIHKPRRQSSIKGEEIESVTNKDLDGEKEVSEKEGNLTEDGNNEVENERKESSSTESKGDEEKSVESPGKSIETSFEKEGDFNGDKTTNEGLDQVTEKEARIVTVDGECRLEVDGEIMEFIVEENDDLSAKEGLDDNSDSEKENINVENDDDETEGMEEGEVLTKGDIAGNENTTAIADDHDVLQTMSEAKKKKGKKNKTKKDDLIEDVDYFLKTTESGTFFQCAVCNKKYTKFKYLKLHTPAHTNKFRCDFCDKKFVRKESYEKHVCTEKYEKINEIVVNDELVYECNVCKKFFPDDDVARQHYSIHRRDYFCELCCAKFPSIKELNEHQCVDDEGNDKTFPCDICSQKFRSEKYLFRHMAMHTDIYKCVKCQKCFSRKDSLQKHVMKCCPEFAGSLNIYSCEICSKAFSTPLGLENHALNCSYNHCKICKKTFSNESEFSSHECIPVEITKDDTGTTMFPCKYCSKDFSSFVYLRRHEATHQGAFQCLICEKKFARKEEHSWHFQYCFALKTLEQEKQVTCPECQEVFTDARIYREHYHTHSHPYSCNKCGKNFRKIGTLHMHTCQGIEGEFRCEVCGKLFRNERYLQRHQLCHGQPGFECEICKKLFHRKDYLNDHSCLMPDGTKARVIRKANRIVVKESVVCHLCGKSFVSSGNLNKHIKIHGDKDCECDICGKRFHYYGYLREHKASVHEKKYKFQCNECGKILFSKTGLQQHMKQFHTEKIVIFTCGTCGKGFRQKGNLKTHMFSHSKERAFECDLCHKTFKYPEQLNRHHLHHTMKNKLACDFCDKKFVKVYEHRKHMETFHSGIVFCCGICGTKCGHRHTLTRHYKRKHPNSMSDLNDPSFISSLQKHNNEMAAIAQNQLSQSQQHQTFVKQEIEIVENEDISQVMSQFQSTEVQLPTSNSGTTVIQNPDGTLTEVRIESEETIPPQVAAEALESLQHVVYTTEGQELEQTEVILDDQQIVDEQTITIPSGSLEVDGEAVTTDVNGEQTLVIFQYVNEDGEEEQIIQTVQQG